MESASTLFDLARLQGKALEAMRDGKHQHAVKLYEHALKAAGNAYGMEHERTTTIRRFLDAAKELVGATSASMEGDEDGFYKVGTVVEARPKNIDELYFEAVIVGVDRETSTYVVLYEDGSEEQGLEASSLICPTQRVVVYEDENVMIMDGHLALKGSDGNDETRLARLLMFRKSVQLCQSAIAFQRDSTHDFEYDRLAFDVDQALCLFMPILRHRRYQEKMGNIRICILGAGGGSVPLALASKHRKDGKFGLEMDVVDISEKVVQVALDYFGAKAFVVDNGKSDEDNVKLSFHIQNGLEFIACASAESYDAIIIDVADEDASSSGLELPPANFVAPDFLRQVSSKLCPGGWIVINVLADLTQLLLLCETFEKLFGTVYVCATDPNYVFYLNRFEFEITHTEICSWSFELGYHETMAPVVLDEISRTEKQIENNILLGWIDLRTFVRLLKSGKVNVI